VSPRSHGGRRGSSKRLTDEVRARILKLLRTTDLTQDEIAVRLGIGQASVSRVKRDAAE